MKPRKSDRKLVDEALAGSQAARSQLVRRWAGPVLAVCHARVKSGQIAEDLAQEALLRGLRALPTLGRGERVGPWLRGIAARTSLDWLKARERGQVNTSTLDEGPRASPEPGPAELASRSDEVRRLLAAVDLLPEALRETIMLFYYDDQSYREIAGFLGVSVATVNARLTKARALLRARLLDRGARA